MPLEDIHSKNAVFIVAPRTDGTGVAQNQPLGTGFVVLVPAELDPEYGFRYIVTAKHLLPGDRSQVSIRVNTTDGGVRDLPAPDWIDHPTDDVSAAFFPTPPDVDAVHVPQALFVDELDEMPLLGDTVYFIGLLGFVKAMGQKNIPMVRSGTLGAKYQDGVPIKWPDGSRSLVTAHLIDCRAYRGFSGSPCYVQFRPETADTISRVRKTALLGLISAHFDLEDHVPLPGDLMLGTKGTISVPVHAGVGVVVPVERIRDVLYDDDFLRMRREYERMKFMDADPELAATADSAEGTPFERFEDALRTVVSVPKEEVDKALTREKKARQARKTEQPE